MTETVAPPTPGPTLWSVIQDLPLRIEAVALEPLERETPFFLRRTTVVRLSGGGHDGVGEDVTYDPDAHPAFQGWAGLQDLRGTWTIASLAEALATAELFPEPPDHAVYRSYRRWAFESAALDLALRQAGRALADLVERPVAEMTFVSSRAVGDPPDPAVIADLRRRSPGLRMKLDLGEAWDADAIAALAATDAVATVDLKGWYRGTTVDTPVDPETYRLLLEGLPNALFEDPGVTEETQTLLLAHARRVTWDVPLRTAADLDLLPFPPVVVNVKPSRIGNLRELSAVYALCGERQIGVYSGGQTELGPGRGQAQLLAALFHPDGPNDLAPTVFNDVELPAELPSSPLPLVPAPHGFRLAGD
ncbi:hypothetical protein [Patulibacter defluvii]|uniref:hypothetical protein n=1 Tax=Patulibacter defluvii TaxID=3095358 RepID=UPI002A7624D5|nr:hypothetical protein [Patulibacter sp. DM4]